MFVESDDESESEMNRRLKAQAQQISGEDDLADTFDKEEYDKIL